MAKVTLLLQTGDYATCRLLPSEPVPAWADTAGFSSITRTADELSIVCAAALVPAHIRAERGWRLFKFQGPFAFTATGILSAVLTPLATAKIGILALSTFDTDYLLVKAEVLAATVRTLKAAGHTVHLGAGAPPPRKTRRGRRVPKKNP
ncbi:MAG: ACT domain-containing protein [Opitutae bacterium]|nr:ACT domain-containing protein [Opitutae bacterium]